MWTHFCSITIFFPQSSHFFKAILSLTSLIITFKIVFLNPVFKKSEAATRARTESGGFLCVLFSAIVGDGFADKCGGAGSVFVNVGFETLVGDVHLAETGEDFVCAGVVVFGDVILQFFH